MCVIFEKVTIGMEMEVRDLIEEVEVWDYRALLSVFLEKSVSLNVLRLSPYLKSRQYPIAEYCLNTNEINQHFLMCDTPLNILVDYVIFFAYNYFYAKNDI